MGKIHVLHRLVVRNEASVIVSDVPFEHHSAALPAYEAAKDSITMGHELTLQHGSRIIRKFVPSQPIDI